MEEGEREREERDVKKMGGWHRDGRERERGIKDRERAYGSTR